MQIREDFIEGIVVTSPQKKWGNSELVSCPFILDTYLLTIQKKISQQINTLLNA